MINFEIVEYFLLSNIKNLRELFVGQKEVFDDGFIYFACKLLEGFKDYVDKLLFLDETEFETFFVINEQLLVSMELFLFLFHEIVVIVLFHLLDLFISHLFLFKHVPYSLHLLLDDFISLLFGFGVVLD